MAILFVSRAALATGIPVSSSRSQVGERADWKTPGKGAFRPVREQKEGIVLGSSINRLIEKQIGKAGPVVAAAINKHLAPVAERAFDRWPIQTGTSKSLLFLQIEVAPGGKSISAKIVNLAPYAAGIRRGTTAQDLIFGPGTEAAQMIARDISKGLT